MSEVLERIDDVLAHDVVTDWQGSPDASSWHPDGVYPRPIGPQPRPVRRLPVLPPGVRAGVSVNGVPHQELTPEEFERLMAIGRDVSEQLERFLTTAVEVAERVSRQFIEFTVRLVPPTPAPDPDPVDPRAHALAMRRARNTGPPVPPPGARERRMGR